MTRSDLKLDHMTKCFSRSWPAPGTLKNGGLALKGNCPHLFKPCFPGRR